MKKYEVTIKTGVGIADYVSFARDDEEIVERYQVGDWCNKGIIKSVTIYENLGFNEHGVSDLRFVAKY